MSSMPARRCPACGRDLRPDARFCDACGRAVAPAATAGPSAGSGEAGAPTPPASTSGRGEVSGRRLAALAAADALLWIAGFALFLTPAPPGLRALFFAPAAVLALPLVFMVMAWQAARAREEKPRN